MGNNFIGNSDNEYDIVIVGAGPAGLTAGIYTARSGLKVLILEEKYPGGMMASAPFVENYPGLHEGVSGLELTNRMEKQAKKFGARINSPEKVLEMKLKDKTKIVRTNIADYKASALILSLGHTYKRLNIPGERKFHGKGVSYCATCDGPFFKEKKVLVVGGADHTAVTAIFLSTLASNVKMVHSAESLKVEDVNVKHLLSNGVEVILNTNVKEIRGKTMVRNVVLEDVRTGHRRILEVDGVFVQIEEEPSSIIAQNAGVRVDEKGYLVVDSRQRTNIEGVYAAGDATNCPIKQIGTAVGQAIVAAIDAFAYVRKPAKIIDRK